MKNPSTTYYRKNRHTKKIIYQCPHCDYQSNNTKIQLRNHINAKHVVEKDRPYQCAHCSRGFAQKAHLDKHLDNIHGIHIHCHKVSSISYIIRLTAGKPCSVKTKARREYYKNHGLINTNDINNQRHEYLPGIYIKNMIFIMMQIKDSLTWINVLFIKAISVTTLNYQNKSHVFNALILILMFTFSRV